MEMNVACPTGRMSSLRARFQTLMEIGQTEQCKLGNVVKIRKRLLTGKGRRFLFLQGLASPFAFHLAVALRNAGADITKVHFCGGDVIFWPGVGQFYRKPLDQWPAYFLTLLKTTGVTDVVLFGDCRPYHLVAVDSARECNVGLHLFEEGYVRPGYITCENYGVNAHSDLPRTPRNVFEAAAVLPEPNPVLPLIEPFLRRALWDVVWHVGLIIFAPLFARYMRHTLIHPIVEYAGWLLHGLRSPLAKRRDRRAYSQVSESGQYFLFPLQLPGDFQMRVHSDFRSVEEVAETVVSSFARRAPLTSLLVVKRHPYDVGFTSSAQIIARLSAANGIADRVVFIENGDITPLVKKAIGVVLVNSTTAMMALENKRPLKVLGRATYNMQGLAYQGSLDEFWTNAEAPDTKLALAYRKVLIARTQIPGGFFSPEGISGAVIECVSRMLSTEKVKP